LGEFGKVILLGSVQIFCKTMTDKETAFRKISELVNRFDEQYASYKKAEYNETLTRRDFIDPFFKALGWDIDNENGYAESYREVIHEDKVKVGKATKAPDYSFRLPGGKRLFFVEAKKPFVTVKDEIQPAYQVRRYGWSARLPISIITDFEEFSVYDCTKKPKPTDKASVARIKYLTFRDYLTEFEFLWDTFSKERVLKGSFDKFVQSDTLKKGTATVDKAFLQSLDNWRTYLATSISWNNKELEEDEINFVVQQTIDRIIFLRIAEDRGVEPENNMAQCIKSGNYYSNLYNLFLTADEKYNSGLFDLKKDEISKNISVDNKVIKNIVEELYYPKCEYAFDVLPVEILGTAYEQFLGKVIRITPAHHAKIEEKPEVRKAGGVYYTPQYVVDYIVQNTVGKLIDGKTPKEVSHIKILDPACGSGSFLLGAYQFLLDWHKNYYNSKKAGTVSKGRKEDVLRPDGNLTTAEKKRILLNNIYGVDIDVNAVEVSKLSLLLKCMEGETEASINQQLRLFNERILPTLDNNIKCGNSLVDTDFYDSYINYEKGKNIKPFNWQRNFTDIFNRNVAIDTTLVFKQQYYKIKKQDEDTNSLIDNLTKEPTAVYNKKYNGGFDIVIGNPPYVKVADKDIFEYFHKHYKHQDYQQDLYLLFLEKYRSLLADGGKLGIIIPNTWLQSIKYRNIRKYLINEYFWENILHNEDHVFNAVVDTHILIFQKNKYIKNTDVQIDCSFKKNIQFYQKINQYELPDNGDIINIIAKDDEKQLFEKIKKQSVFIVNICNVYNGVKPFEKGKGSPSQTEKIVKEKPYVFEEGSKPEGDDWLPLMRGSLMHRYSNFWKNDSWIKYGKWLAAPRNPEIFEKDEKIILRQTGDSIIATIVRKRIICRNNLHIIISEKLNHKVILGFLNSKLTNFYYQQINPEKGEALAEVKKMHVEQLPLPKAIDDCIQISIIKLVDTLLTLYKEKTEACLQSKLNTLQENIDYCEDCINEIVYQLYGLTDDEIRIIEGYKL